MTWELDADPERLDVARLHGWLTREAYWARGRSRATVEAAVAGSWCLGAYDATVGQVGFARLVTDGATYGWLCDVFVAEPHRGRGIARALVLRTLEQCDHWRVGRVMLATRDAHGLYRACGFTDVADGLFLERRVS